MAALDGDLPGQASFGMKRDYLPTTHLRSMDEDFKCKANCNARWSKLPQLHFRRSLHLHDTYLLPT